MKIKTVFILFMVAFSFIAATPAESKMAKLMKQMLQFIKTEKANIEQGKPAETYPGEFEKIKVAKITPGKKLSKDHKEYTSAFLKELGNYYQVKDSAQRKEMFNTMVSTCITCHQRECPGPVATIKSNLMK